MYVVALEAEGDGAESVAAGWPAVLREAVDGYQVVASVESGTNRLDVLSTVALAGTVRDVQTAARVLPEATGFAAYAAMKVGATSMLAAHAQLDPDATAAQRQTAVCSLFDDCPTKAKFWTGQQLLLFTHRVFLLGSLHFPLTECTADEVREWTGTQALEELWAHDELLRHLARFDNPLGNPGVTAAKKFAATGLPHAASVLLSFFGEHPLLRASSAAGWPTRVLFKRQAPKDGVPAPTECLSYDTVKGLDGQPLFSEFDMTVDLPPPEAKPVVKEKKGRSRMCVVQ
jgi:hypothetical protein